MRSIISQKSDSKVFIRLYFKARLRSTLESAELGSLDKLIFGSTTCNSSLPVPSIFRYRGMKFLIDAVLRLAVQQPVITSCSTAANGKSQLFICDPSSPPGWPAYLCHPLAPLSPHHFPLMEQWRVYNKNYI